MYHELPKNYLYASYKLDVTHIDEYAQEKKGVATGFVLELPSGAPIIVTNRHVLDLDFRQSTPKYKNHRLKELLITGRRADDSTYTLKVHEDAKLYFHSDSENDLVLIEARVYLEPPIISLHWHFGMEHIATQEIYSTIEPFDLIGFSGFPDQHDKLGDRPILRSGRIASDPAHSYSWDSKSHGQCVAYEGFSSPGCSGSPIFAPARGMTTIPNSRHGYLIGVNAGHIPNTTGHSGISYFYKSFLILEIIKSNNLN